MKICTVCGEEKSPDLYYNLRASPDGKAYRCKACDNAAVAAYRVKHKQRQLRQQRESSWKFKYNINRDGFEQMWENQQGRCAICSVKLTNVESDGISKNRHNTACVDHCHSTGMVRGLLCAKCNKGIGLLGDSAESLYKAFKYLKDIH